MLAVHLNSLLFILLAAGIGLLRLLAKKAGGTGEDDEPPPLPGKAEQTDEERIRKFLEALGQPTSSKPPPPVRPRPVAPAAPELQTQQTEEAARATRRRKLLSPLPPLTTVPPPEWPRRVIMPRQAEPPAYEPVPVATVQTAAPSYEVSVPGESATPPPLPVMTKPVEAYALAAPGPTPPPIRADIARLFASRDDLRHAIILREVFGPPRSLQPLDVIGTA